MEFTGNRFDLPNVLSLLQKRSPEHFELLELKMNGYFPSFRRFEVLTNSTMVGTVEEVSVLVSASTGKRPLGDQSLQFHQMLFLLLSIFLEHTIDRHLVNDSSSESDNGRRRFSQ
jgi:hypothetical protein